MNLSPRLCALAVLCSLVWTSAFVAGKLAMTWLDTETLLAARFVITAAMVAPIVLQRRWRDRGAVIDGLVLGLLINVATLGMAFHAMGPIGSSMVVILTSCAPFVTLLMAVAIGIERLDARRLAGIVVGFAGVLVVCGPRVSGHADIAGLALAAGAALTFSISTLWTRQRAARHDPLVLAFWQAVAGAVVLLPFATADALPALPLAGWLSVLWLALAVSIGAMLLWMYLVHQMGASRAASLHLMNPVFGLLLGHLFFAEAIGWLDLPGLALVASGILMATRSPAGPAPLPQPSPRGVTGGPAAVMVCPVATATRAATPQIHNR